MMLTLLFALTLAAGDSVPRAAAEPAVVVHRQPALPVVALRLSLLADDPAGYAGAGHLFQHLALPAMEDAAARVGGRVQASRTSDAVVYTVVGPAAELETLAGILAGALREPSAGTAELLRAQNALAQERGAERQVAAEYVRAALRARLFPADLGAAGTDDGAGRLAVARLGEVWGTMYRPDRVSLVAVGDVEIADVRRAFRALPVAPAAALSAMGADSARAFVADTPQATRAWIARAWAAPDADPAALTVTARLLRTHLRRRMTRSAVDVEHWWTHHGQALALVVATPDSLARVARTTVDGALAALDGTLDARLVQGAAAGVRRDMLFYARTPERMAEVLGAFADRGEPADAAQRFHAAVDAVTVDDVRAVLAALRAADPAAVDVAAQRTGDG